MTRFCAESQGLPTKPYPLTGFKCRASSNPERSRLYLPSIVMQFQPLIGFTTKSEVLVLGITRLQFGFGSMNLLTNSPDPPSRVHGVVRI